MNHDISRRKLLWALTTTGLAATTGSGAAALMHDSEQTQAEMTAGTLDLPADPSWGNSDSTGGASPGSISGNEGRETVTLTVSDNPSYVWFRTQCQQCTEDEETLQVRFGLDTDGDEVVDTWLDGFDGTDDGYRSLREARLRLGEGVRLDDSLDPDGVWNLVVEWTTDDIVREELNVTFDFQFYAVQIRHVGNTDSIAPDWECPDDCTDISEEPAISYVAFCAPSDITPDDVEFTLTNDGSTAELVTVPESVGAVLLKSNTTLEVYEEGDDPITAGDSFTFGSAPPEDTHEQERDQYPTTDTDPPRSNSNPCPESEWIKYDVDEDVWTTDGEGGGSQ